MQELKAFPPCVVNPCESRTQYTLLLWLQLFAGTLDAWMAEFHGLLTFETSALPESDPEKETLPDAVCTPTPSLLPPCSQRVAF